MSPNGPIPEERFAAGELAPGAGPGRILREARVAMGLSVEQVAGKLHLGLATVRALEADDYGALPPAIFVRGYLKNLARLFNLDVRRILEAYERQGARDILPEASPMTALDTVPQESRFGTLLMWVMLGAFVGLGWWVYRAASEQRGAAESAATSPSEPTTGEPAIPAAAPELPADRARAASVPEQASGAALPQVPPQAPAVSAPPGSAAAPSLRVRFAGDSWVSVVDADGNRLLYELGSQGSEKLVRGKPPFTVVLGRPAEISLEYQEQPYNHGYTTNRAPARFVIGP